MQYDTLWQNAQKGDRAAFNALVLNYYSPLMRFAKSFQLDTVAAEDVLSDLFFELWTNREKIVLQKNINAYLYGAVRNKSIKAKKYYQLHVALPEADAESLPMTDPVTPESKYLNEELEVNLEKLIDTLPERCREVFRLRRDEQMSYEEIAIALNISINTVKTQMFRAVRQLREQIYGVSRLHTDVKIMLLMLPLYYI